MDTDAIYAYLCLVEFHWHPSEFMEMSREEKAFVIASINKYAKDRKAAREK